MPVRDLFSKRQKRLRGETPDVYSYDTLPDSLRTQIVLIWDEAAGSPSADPTGYSSADLLFMEVERILCKEFGRFSLDESQQDSRNRVKLFFLGCAAVEQCLDVVEVVFSAIEQACRGRTTLDGAEVPPQEAIEELNTRFKEHGVGYEYRNGNIICMNSHLVHAEVVVPALSFLQKKFLAGANEEFLSAHEHYRHKRYKECLNECLKAFESTMKAICAKHGWTHGDRDTAKELISCCIEHGLFPDFLESHLGALRSTLEAGLPTTRNRLSAHGQGSTHIEVREGLAAYALHLTATNILLLASAEEKLK